jgi:hypothetical protein
MAKLSVAKLAAIVDQFHHSLQQAKIVNVEDDRLFQLVAVRRNDQ